MLTALIMSQVEKNEIRRWETFWINSLNSIEEDKSFVTTDGNTAVNIKDKTKTNANSPSPFRLFPSHTGNVTILFWLNRANSKSSQLRPKFTNLS